MAQDFLFLVGRIRALESKLLSDAQVDRMVGAKDAAEAFRILTELQYADYIADGTQPAEFVRIIDQGLIETKELIESGTDHDPAFEFIWREFDLNNLKRALKEKIVDQKAQLGEFAEENGYSLLGNISKENLAELLFGDESEVDIPDEYKTVLEEAEATFKKSQNFRDIEFALDQAHFAYLKKLASKTKSSFLVEYLALLADESNAKVVLRMLTQGETVPVELFMPHGTYEFSALENITDLDSFVAFLRKTSLTFLADPFLKSMKGIDSLQAGLLLFERQIARHKYEFLLEAESGEIESVQVPLAYFMKRLQNSRVIKFIMFAKLYKISPEEIYKTLKHL